jgi:hypothetical protein
VPTAPARLPSLSVIIHAHRTKAMSVVKRVSERTVADSPTATGSSAMVIASAAAPAVAGPRRAVSQRRAPPARTTPAD